MNRLLRFIHVLDKAGNSFGFVKPDYLRNFPALILKDNGQLRVQVRRLMETAFYIVLLEPGFVKNRVIREKINGGSGLSGLPLHRKQSIFQRNNGISPLISVLIDKTAGPYRDTEPGRQRVYHGSSHTM